MKKILIIFISLFLITSCGKNEDQVLINNEEYKLGDTINIKLNFKNDDKPAKLCPTIKITREKENKSNIATSLDYHSENLETLNYSIKSLNESDNNGWHLRLDLEKISDENIIYLEEIANLKLTIKEAGNYQITLDDTEEECYTKYKNDLTLEITK